VSGYSGGIYSSLDTLPLMIGPLPIVITGIIFSAILFLLFLFIKILKMKNAGYLESISFLLNNTQLIVSY